MTFDPYGSDVLADFSRQRQAAAPPVIAADKLLVLEDPGSGFVGAIVAVDKRVVELEDRHGTIRAFPFDAMFLVDGKRVTLRLPAGKGQHRARTASGSMAVDDARAKVALPSRIFVEGRHDAELVERVWGDDLRVEGVVVEYLEGVDDLELLLREFGPSPERRVGVLVDHLVPGSKESRIAQSVSESFGGSVLVVGHPFVDIWQAVKPERLGIAEWPVIPRSIEWKHGVCDAFGWPHGSQADIAAAWKRILGAVRSFADLEPVLLGRVEQLVDFVTDPQAGAR